MDNSLAKTLYGEVFSDGEGFPLFQQIFLVLLVTEWVTPDLLKLILDGVEEDDLQLAIEKLKRLPTVNLIPPKVSIHREMKFEFWLLLNFEQIGFCRSVADYFIQNPVFDETSFRSLNVALESEEREERDLSVVGF